MRILRAIGLGIAIIILKFLVPTIFSAGEQTVITAFETVNMVLLKMQSFPLLPWQ